MATLAALEKPAHRRGGRFPWIPLVCAVWVVGFLALFASRQAPLGGVSGSLVAEDTGQPISGVELMLAPADPPCPAGDGGCSSTAAGSFCSAACTPATTWSPPRRAPTIFPRRGSAFPKAA